MDEARVKQLMSAAGYPESQTIQQLIYQVMNEVEQEVVARFADPDREEFVEEPEVEGPPPWWPSTPYPAEVFPMTTMEYINAVPNNTVRTAISGFMAGFGWQVAERQFLTLFEEYRINLDDPIDIKEVIQALTDSNALLEDLQRAYEILPDSHSGNRRNTCNEARKAYDMGDRPYDPV